MRSRFVQTSDRGDAVRSFSHPETARIVEFLRGIGVDVVKTELAESSFLPGIRVDRGRLLVDESKLSFPGDLLHEAGHIAVIPGSQRADRADSVSADPGEEIAAIAWSYAAVVHLEMNPAVVFHPDGYRGDSEAFLDNFRNGRYIGVPLLQWLGLTLDDKNAQKEGTPPYPHMLRWLCE